MTHGHAQPARPLAPIPLLPALRREAWTSEEGLRSEATELRELVASVHKQGRARAQVSFALGRLVERYSLSNEEDAFALLRTVSQRSNIKVHELAAALAQTTPPHDKDEDWFPGRVRRPSPPLRALGRKQVDARSQSSVLSAVLNRVLDVTGGEAGNVQVRQGRTLRMVQHEGHPQIFTDYFAFVDDGTPCSRAAKSARQVTVPDIARSTGFDEASKQILLDAGSRACHSVPLIARRGGMVLGVVSSHHREPLTGLRQEQLLQLQQLQRVAGTWLDWYQRTVVLDALEALHQAAREAGA
ncbi:ANTAR domain-containing protein [Streptomyces sp. YJ-C3]